MQNAESPALEELYWKQQIVAFLMLANTMSHITLAPREPGKCVILSGHIVTGNKIRRKEEG